MVDVVQSDQVGAYADFDNHVLSRSPERVAVANVPIIDLAPFIREGTHEDRMRTARAVRSACIDSASSMSPATASRRKNSMTY
jgi:hypothetical protein